MVLDGTRNIFFNYLSVGIFELIAKKIWYLDYLNLIASFVNLQSCAKL